MQKLKRVIGIIESTNEHWGIFVGFFIIPIAIIINIEVVSRYVFNSPTIWANTLAQLIYGGFIVMGGAYTLLHNGHVRMDVIYNRLPSARARAIMDSASSGLFFLFCAAMLYKSIPWVVMVTVGQAKALNIMWDAIAYPTYWCLPVSVALLAIMGLIRFIRDLSLAVWGKEPLGRSRYE